MGVTPVSIAQRFLGIEEVEGHVANPQIVAMLQRAGGRPEGSPVEWLTSDEVAWCSAFVFYVTWLLDLPRPATNALRARSWLAVGTPVRLEEAVIGSDVVVLSRGHGPQPGPEILDAPGHVGFYAGTHPGDVLLLGGNQGNAVTVESFPKASILGIRRLVSAINGGQP